MKHLLLALTLLQATHAWSAQSPRDQVIDYLALCYAAQGGNLQLVDALLERGAPVDALDVDAAGSLSYQAALRNSPLQVAAENGHVDIVKSLLRHKPWVDHRCCDSSSALGDAAEAGHLEIVNLLLEAGADPSIKGSSGKGIYGTPIDFARHENHVAVVERLEAALAIRASAGKGASMPQSPVPTVKPTE